MKLANFEEARGLAIQTNPALGRNWQIVKDWNVDIRYQARSEAAARKLYQAVTDKLNGVLPWIRTRW